MARKSRMADLTGQKFGRLTVVSFVGVIKERTTWECVCDCKKIVTVTAHDLKSGHTKSCGCLQVEAARRIGKNNEGANRKKARKYGNEYTKLYRVYLTIIARCCNPNSNNYARYGARGITVCNEWLGEHGFENFLSWAINNGYDPKLGRIKCTIDRIDNNKGYSPHNCRWVDMETQANNKRTNAIFTYQGKDMTLAQLAKESGVGYRMLWYRLQKLKWSVEKALTAPLHTRS